MIQTISLINSSANFLDSDVGHTIRTSCSLGYATGAGALTSVIVGSSLGAAGGAIFGATGWLVSRSVSWISDQVLAAVNLSENTTAKVAAYCFQFFLTTGTCMLALTLAKFPITFTATVILNLATSIILPAIAAIVLISMIAPCIMGFIHWANAGTVNLQAIMNSIAPLQSDVNAGADLINNEVLANASLDTLASFAGMDPSIFQFISAKSIFIYSAGSKRHEEIPNYFQNVTKDAITLLRQELPAQETIDQIQPFLTDLGPFNGNGPELPVARTFFNRLRGIASLETQGISLLNTHCYQRALELVPR